MATAASEIAQKDVALAILGASAGLAGLILVFLGMVISGYQAYPADTPKRVKDRARGAVWPVLGLFIFGVITTALAAVWLVIPGGDCFYWVCVTFFLADLLAIVGLATKTTVDLMD